MEQIVVASDSHGNKKILDEIVLRHPRAISYLHLGDSGLSQDEIYPFISVKGNNDYLIDNEFRIVNINFLNIYMVHGHKMYLSKENMASKARQNNCNFFIFGHTHRPYFEIYQNVYLLNPGALAYPRGNMGATYAIINILDKEQIKVEFIQI